MSWYYNFVPLLSLLCTRIVIFNSDIEVFFPYLWLTNSDLGQIRICSAQATHPETLQKAVSSQVIFLGNSNRTYQAFGHEGVID